MLELTITLPDADADVSIAAHWSLSDGGEVVAGDQVAGPAPALAAIGAALLALVELERPGSDPAIQAADLVERIDAGRLDHADVAQVVRRALEGDGADLVAAALVAAGGWPLPPRRDLVTDMLDQLRAQRSWRQGDPQDA